MKEKFEAQAEQLKGTIKHIKEEIVVMDQGITSDNPYLQTFLKHRNIQTLSKILEPLTITPKDVGAILRDCRVPEEKITDFQTECEKQFGVDAVLKPANLIDTGKFVVKTEYATIAVDPAHSYQVESRIINGKPYILIPVGEGVEINGMAVKVQD